MYIKQEYKSITRLKSLLKKFFLIFGRNLDPDNKTRLTITGHQGAKWIRRCYMGKIIQKYIISNLQ